MLVNHFKDRDGFIYLPRPEHAPRKGAIYNPKTGKKNTSSARVARAMYRYFKDRFTMQR